MEQTQRTQVNAGLAVSVQSVAWTVVSSTLAVVIGLRSGTAVLVAFGAVGTVDGIGSAALAYHFHHALRHDRLSTELERLAHRVVLVGLLVVGLAALITGLVKAFDNAPHDASAAGAALAAASLVVLSVLAIRKQAIARRVGSRALVSDSHLSATGATLAAVALLGIVASRWLEWNWADGAATATIGAGAAALAMFTARTT
jgi:divalent metal cation (Fe/Co/Zn/Cd) transporter